MSIEYLGNNLYREYLGMEFIQKLKNSLKKSNDSDIDLNSFEWTMLNHGKKFIKWDDEYLYYEQMVPDNFISADTFSKN